MKPSHSDVDMNLKTFYGVYDADNLVWEVSLLKFVKNGLFAGDCVCYREIKDTENIGKL